MDDPVSALLEDICGGTGLRPDIYAGDAVLDATVPGWRFQQVGRSAVAAQLGDWYADPGVFEELERTPLPRGELVTFTLTWSEDGDRWTTHQVHLVELADGRITRQQVWCGGRWPSHRVAEMAAAGR
jgi:hypothetical protein